MSIDAGDRWAEYEIKEREQVGRYMYEHQYDYVDRSKYEKVEKQLTKAKEIIEGLMRFCRCFAQHHTEDIRYKDAEQFLKEFE